MKLIRTIDAEGAVLCHDITQIIKGVTKDAVFRKGHIVTKEDIPVLLSVGKDQLYVWEKQEGILHEDEAAEILCRLCIGPGPQENTLDEKAAAEAPVKNMERSRAKEGKIEITAACDGLLKVNRAGLKAVNSFGQMMIASRHGGFPPILSLHPFVHKKAGIVTTGNEVFYGRIEDTFTPVVEAKLTEYDTEIIAREMWNDDNEKVTAAIMRMIEAGADIVCCTGGMSVDPDDRTPLAIKNTGARIVSYGAPVLPGAMFMLAYYEVKDGPNPRTVTIMGLPGCVMYARRTIFDLVLPHVMADDEITAENLSSLGEGGLCLSCPVCTFPNCGFGKGH